MAYTIRYIYAKSQKLFHYSVNLKPMNNFSFDNFCTRFVYMFLIYAGIYNMIQMIIHLIGSLAFLRRKTTV